MAQRFRGARTLPGSPVPLSARLRRPSPGGSVTAPIVGASRPERLDASLAAPDYFRSTELKRELVEVTRANCRGDARRVSDR
jgi:hypothetical protein